MQRFITIGTWAKLAGITREGAYKRLKSGKLKISEYCEHPLIDTNVYPPYTFRHKVAALVEVKCPF